MPKDPMINLLNSIAGKCVMTIEDDIKCYSWYHHDTDEVAAFPTDGNVYIEASG